MALHYGLVCISLADNKIEHLLIHLLAILASYSVIYLYIFCSGALIFDL